MTVRIRALTIEHRALPVRPIHPSPAATATATATRASIRVAVTFIVTDTVTVTGSIRIYTVGTYGANVAWWTLVFIHAIWKTIHQPS